MSQSQMKERYALLGKENQSFAAYRAEEVEDCRKQLAEAMENAAKDWDGKPVFYTIIRHVARSGMSRTISVHYFDTEAGAMRQLNYVASVLLDRSLSRSREGVICRGCGMDMGFDLVYRLAHIGAKDGYAVRQEWL